MTDFLEEHQALIVWLFPIVLAFAGAWIQARGGHAQAKAAEKAATTAAAATLQAVREQAEHAAAAAHAAALREQRISAATNLMRNRRHRDASKATLAEAASVVVGSRRWAGSGTSRPRGN